MPEFSDLLRQRLALGKPADTHPDPDTLTAFSERLLSLREQNRVLEHLALCGQCREVIALSQAALPSHANLEIQSLPARAPRRAARRLWAPLFGLAASVAAMGVVAVLIIRGPHTRIPAPVEQAKLAPEATPALMVAPPPASPVLDARPAEKSGRTFASAESAPRTRRVEVNPAPATRVTEHEVAPLPPMVVAGNATAVSAITASVSRRDYLNEKAIRGADTFTSNQTGTMSVDLPTAPGTLGDASQLTYAFNNKQLSSADLRIQMPGNTKVMTLATAPTSSAGHGLPLIAKAIQRETERIMSTTKRGTAFAIGIPAGNAMTGQAFNPARDRGQSIEIATGGVSGASDLDRSQAFAPGVIMRAKPAGASDARPQTLWAVGDGKLLRTNEAGTWVSGYAGNDNIEFLAVTSHGAEVWAGGRNAALLHSRDGGATWERVRLGENAAGSVKSISVIGVNIQVSTSENQSWFSEDGGRTWTLNQ